MRLAACSLAFLLLGGAASAQSKPKIAVMTVGDQTRTLGESLLESLTDALRTQLAGTGQFVVIDKSRQAAALKRLVREQKRESYKACYDNRCQIPLGQALAADSILRTKVTQVGSFFLINAELVDLAKEAVTSAAQARAYVKPREGRDDRLLRAITDLSRQLGGGTTAPEVTPPDRVTPPPPLPLPPPRHETPEELQRRQELLQQQQAEAQARGAQTQREAEWRALQESQRRRRSSYMIYGWMSVITGAILAGTGVYYATAKVNEQRDIADKATIASSIDSAVEEAKKNRTTGIVVLSLGGIALGAGTALILLAPKVMERPVNVAGVKLDRAPSAGASGDGFAVSWGGKF
jgi:hypothetical protein